MIRKFINKLLGKSAPAAPNAGPAAIPLGQRVEIHASDHGIDPKLLDERAVRVVTTLQDAGYEAYVVGGAVRDLLVGRRPKDFDVATDATPEQVKGLFRRAFIIGRRFRIVHVIHGRGREHEVIEVSTFRAYMDPAAVEQSGTDESSPPTSGERASDKKHVVDASGRVLRDNVWGPQIEDAARRDFTVNAMYYDPRSQVVVDYHGGLQDIRAKVLRMIGDAPTRYREDPVRILRVVRFAAKLGFAIEPQTQKPIAGMVGLLSNVPASRMFDEMLKLLQTGHALSSLAELRKQGLQRGVFPVLDAVLSEATAGSARQQFIELALNDTDRRVAEGKAVAPSFMLACMLWHEAQTRWTAIRAQGEAPMPALLQAVDAVFDARIGDISGRGKLATDMREIWLMQPKFERRSGHGPYSLVDQPRFRAGFDFLRLRADAAEVPAELADWWEDFALGTDEDRQALIDAVREAPRPKRVPQVRPKPGAADAFAKPVAGVGDTAQDGDATEISVAPEQDDDTPGPARKRRRRRRKPAGQRSAGEVGGGGSADT